MSRGDVRANRALLEILGELAAQHDSLRSLMDRCEQLADQLDAGHDNATQLAGEVAQLRVAFEAHNEYEERLLRPVLLEADPFALVRIDRMVEENVGEHREMSARLGSVETASLRNVIDTLRAHLDAEDRYLSSTQTLRDTHSVDISG